MAQIDTSGDMRRATYSVYVDVARKCSFAMERSGMAMFVNSRRDSASRSK